MLAWHIFFPHHVTCVNFIMLESRILKLTHVTWWGKKICQARILLLRYPVKLQRSYHEASRSVLSLTNCRIKEPNLWSINSHKTPTHTQTWALFLENWSNLTRFAKLRGNLRVDENSWKSWKCDYSAHMVTILRFVSFSFTTISLWLVIRWHVIGQSNITRG